jgi:glycosyltransferase involved in cell wall biosynthesis
MVGFEENDISRNSQGGTEITKRGIASLVPNELQQHFQVIPSRVRELLDDKIRIYWVHDLPEDPEINHLKDEKSRRRFHKMIFNCNYHLNDCITKLGIPQDNKIDIIETAVEPIPYVKKELDGTINLIYFSTPQRGLELLVPVFTKLAEKYPNIHLHVFSSWKIYGWEQMDEQFERVYKKIREHPQMTYHGFAPRDAIVAQLQRSHILAYPCIWRETACRVLIESMSAGLMCVHPNYGALADTAGQLTLSYQFMDNHNEHAEIFAYYLDHAIQNVTEEATQNYLTFVKTYADMRFNLKGIAKKWEQLMTTLLNNYPDEKKRQMQVPMFVYKTE